MRNKPYVIAITGTPCTGKTSLAKALAKASGFVYVDGAKIIRQFKLSEGYDSARKANIVDSKRFSKAVMAFVNADFKAKLSSKNKKNTTKKTLGYVVDSHMSHFLPSTFINLCLVTKISISQLNKRLTLRYASKKWPIKVLNGKIRENLDSEIFDVCYMGAIENRLNPLVIDTSKASPIELAKQILKKQGINI